MVIIRRELLLITIQSVEFPGRLRVVLCILSSDWKMHGVPPANITSNHTLMRNVLPNLPSQLGFNLEVLERISVFRGFLLLQALLESSLKFLGRDGSGRRDVVGFCERKSRKGRGGSGGG